MHIWCASLLGLASISAAQTTVSITADRDNTLYSTPSGSLSNGLGSAMFVGRTGSGRVVRGILHFDLSTIPQGATVTDARLEMLIGFSASMGPQGPTSHSVHRVSQDWGEGSTLAPGGQGAGGGSTTDSVTWVHTFFPGSTWANQGGDFTAMASASEVVGTSGAVTLQSAGLSADVQSFVADPATNFGWVLKADDEVTAARVYSTRENVVAANRPTLVVTFEMPLGSPFCGPAVPNQVGLSGEMSATGSAVVADNDLTLVASQLPPQVFGFFIASETQGFVTNPGGSFGNLCVVGSIGRFQQQIQSSGSAGTFSIPVDLTAIPQPVGTNSVAPGDTYFFQAWYRDANGGVPGSNFTDGYEINFN